jgi:hypothetical protein
MKNILKKYLTFEEQYGDKNGVEHVKSLAKEYIEKKIN